MTASELKTALRNGKRIYGTLIVGDSPTWLKAIGDCGLDYVFIDTEHIALDRKELSWMCHAYRGIGLAPIVRIPSPSPYEATVALDAGAAGLLAPYIETPEQVKALIGATKYRPLKGDKLQNYLAGESKPEGKLKNYLDEGNAHHTFFINIESRIAVENLETLLGFPELDGIVIGPHDLSTNYEMPEEYLSDEFTDLVTSIIKRARALGKAAGIHMTWPSGTLQEIAWGKAGATIIMHKADIILFKQHLSAEINEVRKTLGDAQNTGTSNVNI